jgi:DNA-binding transcriptional ArsR family regulator
VEQPERVEPMKDLEVITDPSVFKILLEPVRADIVFKFLVNSAMTVKQLADALGKNPGTILHHIDALKKAGLVVQERTQLTPTGIVQRYYRATAREYRMGLSEMMQSDGGVAKFAKDRLSSTVSGLSSYGIEIPESQSGQAMDMLGRLIERENVVTSNIPILDEQTYRKLSPSVRGDASRIMRRFALEEDSQYRDLREKWHSFLRSHRKGGMNYE